jgi:uncharacterized protein (DUF433 family)
MTAVGAALFSSRDYNAKVVKSLMHGHNMSMITYPHIEINSDGVAIISGTTTKVIEIVQDHLAHHWHAEDICRQYPYLSPAQVHAALTYFYDHQTEMEVEIEQRRKRVADIKARRADDAIEDKLRQLGHLP